MKHIVIDCKTGEEATLIIFDRNTYEAIKKSTNKICNLRIEKGLDGKAFCDLIDANDNFITTLSEGYHVVIYNKNNVLALSSIEFQDNYAYKDIAKYDCVKYKYSAKKCNCGGDINIKVKVMIPITNKFMYRCSKCGKTHIINGEEIPKMIEEKIVIEQIYKNVEFDIGSPQVIDGTFYKPAEFEIDGQKCLVFIPTEIAKNIFNMRFRYEHNDFVEISDR